MFENHTIIWSIIGFVSILLEVSILPGIGFLFAGLGAITTSILLEFNYIGQEILPELTSFAACTVLWAIILWLPLKKYSRKNAEQSYQNIIGSTAYVYGKDLQAGKLGSVKWSGVIMQAKIAGNQPQLIAEGETVTITDIKENILYVAKQQNK